LLEPILEESELDADILDTGCRNLLLC